MPDADVADVARRVVVDRVLPAERRAGGQRVRLEERLHVLRRTRRPTRAAEESERPLRSSEQAAELLDLLGARMRLHDVERLCVRRVGLAREHVLRQREHDRARTAGARRRERSRDVLGDAVRAVDLRDPLRHRPEHPPVVDLLERLALLLVRRDLADEQDQRRRVLERGVHADRRVRRTRPARDDGDARAAGELPVGVGHVRGAGFVAARDQADRRLVQAVEQREEALARNAEDGVGAVDDELVDEELAAVPAHSCCSR